MKSKSKYSDAQIIEGFRQRDNKVIDFVIQEYKESIKLHILNNSGSHEDAEDIYQECLEILIKKIDKYDFKLTCKFKTFLFSICNKRWLSVLEKRQSENNYHIRKNVPDQDKSADEVLDCMLYNGIFWECFNKLQDNCKSLLRACLKDLPIKDIADILNYSTDYVRKKKCICHEYLFNQITNHPKYIEIKSKEGDIRMY